MIALFSMLPEIMKKKNLKIEEIEFIVDSVYFLFPEKYRYEQETTLEMFKYFNIKKFFMIPKEFSSALDLRWSSKEAQIYGPKLNENFREDDFMFWRQDSTRMFVSAWLEAGLVVAKSLNK